MAIIEWQKDDTIAVIKLNNGENRQNLEFAQCFTRILDEIIEDTAVTAAVITSADEKFWSLGVDIDWLGKQFGEQNFDNIKKFMYGMNQVFTKLLLLPVPVIVAINGHAFGNGAILACACDFRLMKSDRGYFCFPEVDLGIPFLPGMVAFVRKAVPEYKFNEMKLTGKRAGAAELAESHIILKSCANEEELMAESLGFARTFTKKRGIFGEHKKRMHKHIVQVMETEDPEFIEPLFLMIQD
ncbi:MAG: enoyl-CoA hydratase/isomerase family protein [Desulfobacterales bacterium]